MRRTRSETRTGRHISRVLAVAVAYLLALGAVATPAWATSDTGYVYKADVTLNNGVTINACVRGIIADIADNRAWAGSRNSSGTGCTTTVSVPARYLGAQAYGYRDGAYCGATSRAYNGSSTSSFGIGNVLCSNPAGLQAFRTSAYGEFYRGPAFTPPYVSYNQVTPNQSY